MHDDSASNEGTTIYVIQAHPDGGYTANLGNIEDEEPPVTKPTDKQFNSWEDALAYAQAQGADLGPIIDREVLAEDQGESLVASEALNANDFEL